MTSRRTFIVSAAVTPLVPLPAAVAGETSPVRAKFEEWRKVLAWALEPGIGDDECDRRTDALSEA